MAIAPGGGISKAEAKAATAAAAKAKAKKAAQGVAYYTPEGELGGYYGTNNAGSPKADKIMSDTNQLISNAESATKAADDAAAAALATESSDPNAGRKYEVNRKVNEDGSVTIFWSDKTSETIGGPIAGSTGGTSDEPKRTLAKDTFKNTLALLFGAEEASKPWVDGLYKSAEGFYISGSTIEEAVNLSIRDVRNNKDMAEFVKRFSPIYALSDRLAAGEAVSVPTVAELFTTEAAIGDAMRAVNLPEFASQSFIAEVLSMGKSYDDVINLVDNVFNVIEDTPEALRKDMDALLGLGVDRTSIAKAMLLGDRGAQELQTQIKNISVFSAAKTQGVNIGMDTASDIAKSGYNYQQSLTGFGQVKSLDTQGQRLAAYSKTSLGAMDATNAVFNKNQAALDTFEKLSEEEKARYKGRSGASSGALSSENSY
jgi:hypothetical protein